MTAERRWKLDSENIELGLRFTGLVARVSAGSGDLRHLDQPVLVGCVGPTLAMLSVSGGMASSKPGAAIEAALQELLAAASAASLSLQVLPLIRRRLFEMFQRGVFLEALPNGVVVNLSGDGEASGFKFGPVAAAVVRRDIVEPLHPDHRFPALKRLGAHLESILPPGASAEPLVLAVSSLTQLDPTDQANAFHTKVPLDGSLMLMSRGAVPFTSPQADMPMEVFARMDSGWMHGMSGVVVQIFREDHRPPEGNSFPWLNGLD